MEQVIHSTDRYVITVEPSDGYVIVRLAGQAEKTWNKQPGDFVLTNSVNRIAVYVAHNNRPIWHIWKLDINMAVEKAFSALRSQERRDEDHESRVRSVENDISLIISREKVLKTISDELLLASPSEDM